MIKKVLELIKSDENKPERVFQGIPKITYYDSMDFIFKTLDDLLLDEKLDEVGNIFKESIAFVNAFPIVIMMSYLSITNYPGNFQLANRLEFYNECLRILRERGESKEKIDRLFRGFENR